MCAFFTLKFGTNATFRNRLISGSALTVSPTALISLMIRLAIKYPGAALPPKMKARCGIDIPGFCLRRWYSAMMCRTLRCWRLYSWMRLTWTSNIQSGFSSTPVAERRNLARRALLPRFTSRHCWRKEWSSMNGSSPRSFVRSVSQPSPTVRSSSSRSPGLASARNRRGVTPVCLVAEPLRPQLEEVFEHTLFQQLRVQRRDTVDGVAADGRQVGHPDLLAAVLADQRHPADTVLVIGEPGAHLVEEPAVDLIDDLEVAGQRLGEHLQRPGLQRLGQQGVVGIAERRDRDVPGLVPVQVALVDQQPHELGDRDRRMCVVELQGEPLGEFLDARVGEVVHDVQHVLQRAGHEEVLLEQAQPLACLRLVIGVQNFGDC